MIPPAGRLSFLRKATLSSGQTRVLTKTPHRLDASSGTAPKQLVNTLSSHLPGRHCCHLGCRPRPALPRMPGARITGTPDQKGSPASR